MRRAIALLSLRASYALTDGFPVAGLGMPSTAVWKGDASVACVAAASVLAKVTRDRIMVQLHERWPNYDFARHKGYVTPEHSAALRALGPCPQHRRRYVNVRAAAAEAHVAAAEAQVSAAEARVSAAEVAMRDNGDVHLMDWETA